MNKIDKINILRKLDRDKNGYKKIDEYESILKEYMDHFHGRLSSYIGISFLSCVLLISISIASSFYNYPIELFFVSTGIKVFITIPLFLILYKFSKIDKFKSGFQDTIVMFGTMIILSFSLNMFFIMSYGHDYAYERIILALVAVYTLSGLEHKRALFLSLILTFTFILMHYFFSNNIEEYKSGITYLTLINMMGFVYTYKRDYLIKTEFIKSSLIKIFADNDYLTGLNNRRTVYDIFERYEDKKYFSLALIDIDHFKKYNDHYGHILGDNALVSFSNIITSYEDKSLYVSRYGGEEFLIIAFGDDKVKFKSLINSIILDLDKADIEHEKSEFKKLTVSIGVASYQKENNLNYYINKTDELLYKAKKSGRNKLVTD
jgi:diguanylate cyclase